LICTARSKHIEQHGQASERDGCQSASDARFVHTQPGFTFIQPSSLLGLAHWCSNHSEHISSVFGQYKIWLRLVVGRSSYMQISGLKLATSTISTPPADKYSSVIQKVVLNAMVFLLVPCFTGIEVGGRVDKGRSCHPILHHLMSTPLLSRANADADADAVRKRQSSSWLCSGTRKSTSRYLRQDILYSSRVAGTKSQSVSYTLHYLSQIADNSPCACCRECLPRVRPRK